MILPYQSRPHLGCVEEKQSQYLTHMTPLETVLFLQHNLLNLLDMVSIRKLSHSSEPVPGSTLADSPTLVQHASAR